MVRSTCFICLQYKKKRIQPVHLISLQPEAQCSCDAIVHAECLETWYKKSDKCPICREEQYSDFISEEENIEQIVAVQIVRTSKIRQIVMYFVNLRQESKRMMFLFFIWSVLIGVILLSKPVVFVANDDYIL